MWGFIKLLFSSNFIDRMETGTIKFYKADKGFGFIERDGQEDLFFHIKNCQLEGDPEQGQQVQYEVGQGRKGDMAVDVRLS